MNFFANIKLLMLITLAINASVITSQYLEEESIEELVEISEEYLSNDKVMCRNEITGEPLDWYIF